jgi:translocation and assembly module TamB
VKPRLILRLFGYAAVTLLILLCLLLGALGYLLHSPTGTQWLFSKLDELAPGELIIDRVQGRLTGPLELTGLSYRDGALDLEVQHFLLDWKPSQLLEGRLHLLHLTLEGTRLQLPQSETTEDKPAEPFPGIRLPLAIQLDSLLISDFRLISPDQSEPTTIERISLQARTVQDRLSIEQLQADAFAAHIELSGSLQLTSTLPLQLELAWRYRVKDGPELAGQGSLAGDLDSLEVSQTLAPPLQGQLQVELFELLEAPRWQASLRLDEARVSAFVADFPALIKGELTSSGTPERLQADARLDLSEPSLGQLTAVLKTHYGAGTLEAERLLLTTPAGTRIEGSGRYDLSDPKGRLQADLSWQELRWPLQGETLQFQSARGTLNLDGSPDAYRYRTELDLSLPDLPPANLHVAGNGDLQQLVFDTLELKLSEGRIQGSGQLAWSPALKWQANLQGQGLNPGLFNPEFPGNLALALSSRGKIEQSIPQVELQLERLEGLLRDYPVDASAELRLDNRTLQIDSLQARSGENRIQASGSAGETLALGWSIEAPQLEALWPGLDGILKANGRLTGKRETPRIQADIDIEDFALAENRIGRLHAVSDLDLGGSQALSLDLQAQQLQAAELTWQTLELAVTGSRERHQVQLELTGDQVPQAQLALDGGLSQQFVWQGRLQQLRLELPDLPNWRLAAPVPLTIGAAQQQLAQTCLVADQARICGQFSGQAGEGWNADLKTTRLALELAQPWLPEALQIAGQLELTAAFRADAKGRILGNAELWLPKGEFAFEVNDAPQSLNFAGSRLQSVIDPQGARAELNLPLAGLGGIQGQVRLPGLQLPSLQSEQQDLEGQLTAHVADLAFVTSLAPKLKNVSGRIDADFALSGQLASPRVKGQAALQNGSLDIPEAGLELRELVVQLEAPNLQQLDLEGSVKSGKGSLTLRGRTQLQAEQGFPTKLQIKGENWQAINIPEAEVLVSPDLSLESDRERTKLSGEVVIPYGRIQLRKVPKSAVTGSPDLVIVTDETNGHQVADPKVVTRVRIILGDRVSFEGMGLSGKLSGNLLVIDEPGRPITGSGRIGISEGTYQAYGQELKIERGYALFADSPVDNPGLDVRAVREVGDITAGVRVSGTLKTPRLTVFSTPAMRESEALSYLLTGRAPGDTSSEEIGLVAALKAAGVSNLAGEIGQQIGLEELRVDTESGLDEASVVAGTYLSPRLYMQYVNNLASRETKVRLRYDMTKRLQIQTESGNSQGVDLFYTIER